MATANENKPAGPDLAKGVLATELRKHGQIAGHVDGTPVLLASVGDEFFAIEAQCTHYGGPLGEGVVDGDTVRCPWHHACFSLRTGEALRAPAFDPVKCRRVKKSGDRIVVGEEIAAQPRKDAKPGGAGETFLIVGGGAAGFAAAERLRRENFEGEVVILSSDPDLPVDRPNLSKDFLAGKAPEDWVFIKPADFYQDRVIRLELNTTVSGLDPAKREVALADGRRMGFSKLLLATGAEPLRLSIPGADRPNVFTLRTLADSRAIVRAASDNKAAVVVGASFIGLEVAASLRARGIHVEVVAPNDRPLEEVLGPQLGDLVRAEHEAHGVIFHFGRKASSIGRNDVTLDDGSKIRADFVVMGVGVSPRTSLAEAAGLRVDHGVLVDPFLETSAPGIFAAGDIARFPYALPGGGNARVEHWVVAERQGQVAALNMLGRGVRYAQAPFFWSQHYDLTINYVGYANGWDANEISGNASSKDAILKLYKSGKFVAAATIHRDRDNLLAELELERAT